MSSDSPRCSDATPAQTGQYEASTPHPLQYPRTVPTIRITVDGKLALTVEQAALRYGLARSSMRSVLVRLNPPVEPVAELDGRKKLYPATPLDRAMKARPGKGVNLRGHGPVGRGYEGRRRYEAPARA